MRFHFSLILRRKVGLLLPILAAATMAATTLLFIQHVFHRPLAQAIRLEPKMIKHTIGNAYATYIIDVSEGQSGILYEDGHRFGSQVELVDQLRHQDTRGFKAKAGKLFFTSSDGTNPRTNGRRYVFVTPLKVPPGLMFGLMAASIALVVSVLLIHPVLPSHLATLLVDVFSDRPDDAPGSRPADVPS